MAAHAPFQGSLVPRRRHPGAALRLPPAITEQAFSLRLHPPILSRTPTYGAGTTEVALAAGPCYAPGTLSNGA